MNKTEFELGELTTCYNEVNDENEFRKTKIAELEDQLAMRQIELKTLNQDLETMQATYDKTEQSLFRRTERANQLSRELDELKQELLVLQRTTSETITKQKDEIELNNINLDKLQTKYAEAAEALQTEI